MSSAPRVIPAMVIALLLLVPGLSAAQNTGSITGVARDTSGAVLPGVTVEAASPALIEKVRSVVTDEQGRFNIVDLRPGAYTVTFTLAGFSPFRREGVELSAGFTATANAEMKVGGLTESVTVTGSNPIVDIRNVRSQQVVRAETLSELPSGLRDPQALAAMTLGATTTSAAGNDVGGASAEGAVGLMIHGGRSDDGRLNWDGMNTNLLNGGGGGQYKLYKFNMIAVQETVIETGVASASSETGGANINMIPREGANTFGVNSSVTYTSKRFASGKVSDALLQRGSRPDQNSVKKVYDYGVGIGGPIVRDRLWFFSATRMWGGQSYGANNYFNKSPVFYRYEADLSRPAFTNLWQRDSGGRFTWQAATKHKINSSLHWQRSCNCDFAIGSGANNSPEAATDFQYGAGTGMWLSQTSWTYPATNRLLFQVSGSLMYQAVQYTDAYIPGPQNVRITEQTTGKSWGSLGGSTTNGYNKNQPTHNINQHAYASYVSGVHQFKTGLQMLEGISGTSGDALPTGMNYTFRNGAPLQITEFASPFENQARIRSVGVFAQDQWTINRLTVNLGLRWQHFYGFAKAITVPAGPFVGERSYPKVNNIPNFQDITPRAGLAYDLFGNSRTAVKAAWGRYLRGMGAGPTHVFSPSNAIFTNTTRQWTDANGDFVPNCVLTNLLANGECGTVANLAFGQPAAVTRWAESSRTGWGVREFNYQTSVALQHELRRGLGVTVSYNRTDWRNQTAVVNNALGLADYTPYCVTAPTDGRLGAYSGRQICGLYDEVPAKTGQVDNILMRAKDVPGAKGTPKEVFNGVDIAMNARFAGRGMIAGGVTFGRTTFEDCWVNDLPNVTSAAWGGGNSLATRNTPRTSDYCAVQSPMWDGGGSQVKFQAVYPLPYDFMVSGTFKHLPGNPLTATYVATTAQVRAALGRDLSACRGAAACTVTTSVPLLPSVNNQGNAAAVLFDERITQLDLRLSRGFRFGGGRIRATADLYNVFNRRPPVNINTTYGAAWLTPTSILGGRLFEFGAQIDF